MSSLPVSVRLALWTTAANAGRLPLAEAVGHATADLDASEGCLPRLQSWADFGQRAVLVALPHPGAAGLLPRGTDLLAAAVEAGECVYVPGLGDALVPEVIEHGPQDGPAQDRVAVVSWAAHAGEPVPSHQVEALDLRDAERHLRSTLLTATGALEALDAPTWASDGLRELADARLGGGRWGLPPGLGDRARAVISQAATLGTVADVGLTHLRDAHSLQVTAARRDELLRLRREADHVLAVAASVAALHLAGWRGPERD